jgi:predicted RNA-binding protein with RPS1 domain
LDDKRIDNPENHFQVDQELDLKIIKMNLLERRIGLSVKALRESVEREPAWSYTPEVGTASIGDLAGQQLGEFRRKSQRARGGDYDKS